MKQICTAHPNGHFYSPVVDPSELVGQEGKLWSDTEILGIDFQDDSHETILRDVFPTYIGSYDYPEKLPETRDLANFFTQNSQFSWLDARALFVLLQEWRPARIVEVGSGFSSLLIADVNRRFLAGATKFTCIEPYPRPFLKSQLTGLTSLLEQKVQNIDLGIFDELEDGDVLFIDSSHVAKTGSDVNFLYFEVLPRLKPGVFVHIHDIFFPLDYPQDWVLKENRSWNEQYLLRALLMYSNRFDVVFGCNYAFCRHQALVAEALDLAGAAFGGGSFWIRTR